MRRLRTCVAVTAVASMAVLTACTSSSDSSAGAGGSSGSGSSGSSASSGGYAVSTSDCTDPGAATKKITGDIKLGYSVALSGAIASTQAYVNAGIKARIAVANAKGGVAGHQLAATFSDDAYDPQRAKQNIDQFIQQGYDVLLTTGAGQLATTTGDQNDACVPMLGAQASSPTYRSTANFPWTTEYLPSSDVEMRVLGQLLKTKYPDGVKVGVAVAQSETGQSYLNSLKSAVQGSNVSVVATAPTTSPNDAAATLKASGAQVLFIAAVATDCLNLPVAAARAGWQPELVVEPSSCADPNTIYKPAGQAANGALVLGWVKQPTDPSFASDPAGAEYDAAVKAQGGDPTNIFTMSGYTNTDIVIDALGKAASSGKGLTHESIMDVARTQQYAPPLFLPGVKWQMTPAAPLGIASFQPLVWDAAAQKFNSSGPVISGQ